MKLLAEHRSISVEPALQSIGRHRVGTGLITVMLVESHPLVRWAFRELADQRGDMAMVGEAATAQEAAAIAFAVHPDVAVIECTTRQSDGWALCAKLRGDYPEMGIVILTSEASDELLFRALDLGASAFVIKSAPVTDVIAAIQHAAASPLSFTAAGLADAMRRRHQVSARLSLSPREHEILILLYHGMSVPQIAGQLFVSISTAKTYVARLYDKLDARNRAQALMTAVRLGLLEEQLSVVG
jgi:DNA-binding NarL/FixJ family response regulator